MSIIAPYRVAPPQGNLLGFMQDWMAKNQAMDQQDVLFQQQLADRATQDATMAAINQRLGYQQGIDPTAMLRALTGQSNLDTAEQNRVIRGDEHQWRGDDRAAAQQSAENYWGAFQPGGALEGSAVGMDVQALLESGANPQLLEALVNRVNAQVGDQRTFDNNSALSKQDFEQRSALNKQDFRSRLDLQENAADLQWNDNMQRAGLGMGEWMAQQQEIARQRQLANEGIASGLGVDMSNNPGLPYIGDASMGAIIEQRMLQDSQQRQMIAQQLEQITAGGEKMNESSQAELMSIRAMLTDPTIPVEETQSRLDQFVGRNQDETARMIMRMARQDEQYDGGNPPPLQDTYIGQLADWLANFIEGKQ